MALDRKCIVCPDKHHYKYCSNCSGYNSVETWRFLYCSENCREIYDIATKFVNGKLSGLDAKHKLEKLDLSDLEFYHSVIKKNIEDILAFEDVVESEEKKVAYVPVVFVPQMSISNDEYLNISSITTVASSNEEHKIYPRKKKNRKNNIVNVD